VLVDDTLRRHVALAAFAERRLRENYLGRAATFYGWSIAVSYALLMLVAPASAWALVGQALLAGGVIVGALALGAALRDAANGREEDAFGALAREAGFGGAAAAGARVAGAGWRAVRALGVPVLALTALAVAVSLAEGTP